MPVPCLRSARVKVRQLTNLATGNLSPASVPTRMRASDVRTAMRSCDQLSSHCTFRLSTYADATVRTLIRTESAVCLALCGKICVPARTGDIRFVAYIFAALSTGTGTSIARSHHMKTVLRELRLLRVWVRGARLAISARSCLLLCASREFNGPRAREVLPL